ncbi:MAG TPA: hypothetical protein PLX08_07840 [Bacteroidales bacterium]|nr:hypothetical protein [Bacteroidales bacterium]
MLKILVKFRPVRKRLKRFCANVIQRRIMAGKVVYFESLLEELAFRYSPGQNGDAGKYYAKYYCQNEFEIQSNSSAVYLGVNEGMLITRRRYERYHLIKGDHWVKASAKETSVRKVGT